MGLFALTALTALTSIVSKGGVLVYYISIYKTPARVKNCDFAYFIWQNFVFVRENVKKYDTKKMTAIML